METGEIIFAAGILFMSFSIWGVIIWKMLFVNHDDKNQNGGNL